MTRSATSSQAAVSSPGRTTLDGTICIFLAEALLFPTGLITAAFLTRRLGAEGYGLFTLAATLVSWIEWSIASVFSRATIKFIGEAEDWKPVGVTVVRLHLWVSVGLALLLLALSGPISRLLGEPILARYLSLFAWDIPLFSLAQAHRNILVGLGGFRQRALATSGRWIARLLLIVVLVQLGFSLTGAILGSIGASLVELILSRWFVRPPLICPAPFSARRICDYALPLLLFALSMRLYDKLDLFLLKMLGGSAVQAGIYAAAQNLALIPGIFALSFSPVLLSNLSRALRAGDAALAKSMSRDSLRVGVALLALAGLIAGAAPEIVVWLFGAPFQSAGPLLAWLVFAAVALAIISIATTILTAFGRPGWTFALAGPLVPVVILCHLGLIPRWGAIGAAWGTTLVACLGALATIIAVNRLAQIRPPIQTLWRCLLLSLIAFLAARGWHAPGFLLLIKLPLLAFALLAAVVWLGDFGRLPTFTQAPEVGSTGGEETISLLDSIPIQDDGEPLVDLQSACAGVILRPTGLIRRRRKLWARAAVSEKLGVAQARLNARYPGYQIVVIDAWRSPQEQARLYHAALTLVRLRHPFWPAATVRETANKYVAATDTVAPAPHTTGGAVDVRLLEPGQTEAPMGPWSKSRTDSGQILPHERDNRAILIDAMTCAGFSNYPEEWWHWSYGDSGWALRTQASRALYGGITLARQPTRRFTRPVKSSNGARDGA